MQIQGTDSAQVNKIINGYISQGWYQLSLATKSMHMDDFVQTVNNYHGFQGILESNEIGINAQKLVDVYEFVLTLVFNPSSDEARRHAKGLLDWLKRKEYIYGKRIFYDNAEATNLIAGDLQKTIDFFWKEPERDSELQFPKADDFESIGDTKIRNKGVVGGGRRPKLTKKFWLTVAIGTLVVFMAAAFIAYIVVRDKPDMVAKFSNPAILKHFYSRTENWYVKESVILNIEDEQFLFDILMNGDVNELYLHPEAVDGIDDRELLMEICINYPWIDYTSVNGFYEIMEVIAPKIDDQDFFIEVAEKTQNLDVRASALPYIKDPKVVEKYVQGKYHEKVRMQAIKLISNDSLLLSIVENEEEEPYMRDLAARQIESNPILVSILENENYKSYIRNQGREEGFLKEMLDKINNEDSLFYIAMGHAKIEHPRFLTWVLDKIKDPDKLKEIALNSSLDEMRRGAVASGKIPDKDLLIHIAKTDSWYITAEAAVWQYIQLVDSPDPEFLEEITLLRKSANMKFIIEEALKQRGKK